MSAAGGGIPEGRWLEGTLPANVRLGEGTLLRSDHAFKRFHSTAPDAVVVGRHSTLDGVHFAAGEAGRIAIGDYCYLSNAVLLCEERLEIGSYVVVGWNATIADTDFHPVDPAERVRDALACSPLGKGMPRPPIRRAPVVIEDAVWIGANATILKGVRIGQGAFIEPGAVVTRDVPPLARVLGNPGTVVGEVPAG